MIYDALASGYDAGRGLFDSNGNTQTKVVGSNTTSYSWDYENRLSSVTLPGSGGTVSFKYDPFGRRIYKSSSSGTSVYVYDLQNLIEETNSSGAVVARYTQAVKIDEPLAMLRSGTTSFYNADALGSVTSLSSAAGSLVQTYGYDSFGKQTSSSGSLTNPFQFTGRELDTETGLYYYRARYYDPNVGRFLSEDEVGNDTGLDLYIYVGSSPLDSRDPTGLYGLKGFSPGDAQKMRDGINSAINALGKGCEGCAGSLGPKIIQALQNATFIYVENLRSPIGLRECANAEPLNTKTIHIGLGAFSPRKCGCLPATLAHEATHKAQQSRDEHYGGFGPVEMEKACFAGCQ